MLEEKYEYARLKSFSLPSVQFDKELVDCTRCLDAPFVKWLNKMNEIEIEMGKLSKAFKETTDEITSMVVENIEEADVIYILISLFCELKSYEQIHNETGKEYRSISCLKNKGIKILEAKYNES